MRRHFLICTSLLLAGCAPRSGVTVSSTPIADASAVIASLEGGARLQGPVSVRFGWTLEEQGSPINGNGLARAQPPSLGRLDLFLVNGETVAEARLVNDALSVVPPNVPAGMIPPPPLLWAALGVFRPGEGSRLIAARGDVGAAVELRYRSARGEDMVFTVEGDRIREVALLEGGNRTHEVVLTTDATERFPSQAVYRNLAAFRRLTLRTQSIEHVDAFPADVFTPLP